MAKVTLKGTGQLNGTVVINKTIEMDIVQARSFGGPNRDDAMAAALAVYYPGVKQVVAHIDPK